MSSITIKQINDAIETTLGAASSLKASQSIDEISEGIQDFPLLQVYWESANQDPSGGADRSSFNAVVRRTDLIYTADLFVAPRAHLAQNLGNMTTYASEIVTILESQDATPAFGLAGIKAFSWSAARVIIEYATQAYLAVRFTINIRVF